MVGDCLIPDSFIPSVYNTRYKCRIFKECRPPRIKIFKKIVSVCEGGTTRLRVKVVGGNPPPHITWCYTHPNSGSCHSDINQRGIFGSTLLIEKARKKEHEGWYQVFVDNGVWIVSESVYLYVQVPDRTHMCSPVRCILVK